MASFLHQSSFLVWFGMCSDLVAHPCTIKMVRCSKGTGSLVAFFHCSWFPLPSHGFFYHTALGSFSHHLVTFYSVLGSFFPPKDNLATLQVFLPPFITALPLVVLPHSALRSCPRSLVGQEPPTITMMSPFHVSPSFHLLMDSSPSSLPLEAGPSATGTTTLLLAAKRINPSKKPMLVIYNNSLIMLYRYLLVYIVQNVYYSTVGCVKIANSYFISFPMLVWIVNSRKKFAARNFPEI